MRDPVNEIATQGTRSLYSKKILMYFAIRNQNDLPVCLCLSLAFLKDLYQGEDGLSVRFRMQSFHELHVGKHESSQLTVTSRIIY